jgi:hypothetical protein
MVEIAPNSGKILISHYMRQRWHGRKVVGQRNHLIIGKVRSHLIHGPHSTTSLEVSQLLGNIFGMLPGKTRIGTATLSLITMTN